MRQFILVTIAAILLSCHVDTIEKIESCTLTKGNAIKNLKSIYVVSPDSLTINFENSTYELWGYAFSVTKKGYNYKINRRTTDFINANGDLECSITQYYPEDSSYFNNGSFLKRFLIMDSETKDDRVVDSLVFVKQCSFNFHLQLTTPSGEKFKTIDRTDRSSNFYQIDSIKYIDRGQFEYAQYKVYGHFKTSIISGNNKEELISGELRMQFETEKK